MEISNKNKPVKVGVFVLIGLGLFLIVFIFYILGNNQKLFGHTTALYLFMENAQNLESGSFVHLAGIKAGVVTEMKFIEKDNHRGVRIKLKIDKKYSNLITRSSKATVETRGMLGSKYVEVSLGKSGEKPIEDGSYLTVESGMSATDAFKKASAALQDFSVTLNNINQVAKGALEGKGVLGLMITDRKARHNLSEIFDNLNSISTNISQGRGNAGKLVQDTTLYTALERTAINLRDISDRIKEGKGNLGKLVQDSVLFNRINNISVLTDSLLERIDNSRGTLGKLINDKQVYDQLLDLIQQMDSFIKEIKEHPGSFLKFKIF